MSRFTPLGWAWKPSEAHAATQGREWAKIYPHRGPKEGVHYVPWIERQERRRKKKKQEGVKRQKPSAPKMDLEALFK